MTPSAVLLLSLTSLLLGAVPSIVSDDSRLHWSSLRAHLVFCNGLTVASIG